MNNVPVIQFDAALQRGDDASALSLLENRRVTINSVYVVEADGVRISEPVISRAVAFMREQAVQALVRLGASIDMFSELGNGDSVTPACDAIIQGNVPALSLCHRLGANLPVSPEQRTHH